MARAVTRRGAAAGAFRAHEHYNSLSSISPSQQDG